MNFTNRDSGGRQSQPAHNAANSAAPVHVATTPNTTLKQNETGNLRAKLDWLRGSLLILLFSVSIILVSLVYLLHAANPTTSKYVDEKRLQAVFLSNNQVYFGHIKSISSKYINLRGIFYLNNATSSQAANSSSTANTSLSLVKLGCELHGPIDMMIINQDQVVFWENLRDDGQVAKAVADYQTKNPNGMTCPQTNQSAATQDAASSPQSSPAPTPKKP